MKSLKFFLLTAMFLLVGILTFAQDSTLVHTIQDALPGFAAANPVFLKIVLAFGIVSEILSLIPPKYIPANGVLHGIYLLIRAVFPK